MQDRIRSTSNISNTHSFEGNKKCGQIILFVHCGSLQKKYVLIFMF